jgi:hypothetical protein
MKHVQMFNIPAHKENTNQNDIEISPHTSQNGYHQEQTTRNAGEDDAEQYPYTLFVRM